jgi:RNA polymerase sigma factor (sigma-70 family)
VDYQALLVEHLDLVDRLIRYVAQRHHLAAADIDDFASLVRYKLVDRDFAVLRKFEGRSAISTYLTTVIERIYLDFCNTRWGKWRPSASARRLGLVAIRLEELLARDGLSFDEAVATLHTNHGVADTREDLHRLLLELPERGRSQARDAAVDVKPERVFDRAFDRFADRQLAERIEAALRRGVARLTDRDRLILKLRYLDDLSLAGIARFLQSEPKPLYRRMVRILGVLRYELRRSAIQPGDIDRIVGHPELLLGRILSPGEPSNSRENPRPVSV